MNKKPPVCKAGKIFYLTTAFPPVSAGSSVINKNLLSYYDEESYVLLKSKVSFENKIEGKEPKHTYNIFRAFYNFPGKVNFLLNYLQIFIAVNRVKKLVNKYKPVAIVAVYPDYYFLKIGREVAKDTGIPLFPYLHDTLAEALAGKKPFESLGIKLQEQIFSEARKLFVMSKGMSDLYKQKYNVDAIPLLHSYLEEIASQPGLLNKNGKAFWGGDIYSINHKAFVRVANILDGLGLQTLCATNRSIEWLKEHGLKANVETSFFGNRKEYISAVSNSYLLILALNNSKESTMHEDELATIFPTKTIEYLATGNLIIVHCPQHYFLARFFNERKCGIVISTENAEEMKKQLTSVLNDAVKIEELRKNALKVAEDYRIDKVAGVFTAVLNNNFE